MTRESWAQQLEHIVDTIPDGVLLFDKNGCVIYANRAAARIFNVDRDDIVGRWCTDALWTITPLDGTPTGGMNIPCAYVMRTKKSLIDYEVYLEHPKKMRLMLSITALPYRDETGEVTGVAITLRDITLRKQAEEALRNSELRYRRLFEGASDAIFIVEAEGDNVGQIVSTNRAAAEMHGYTMDELLSMKITDLDTPESAREAPARIERILKGETVKFEAKHYRKDGTVFPVEVHADLLELGGHKYIQAFDRDITKSKRMQELSDALNDINASINSTLDFDEIMQRVIVESTRAIGAESAAIILKEDGLWVPRYLYKFPRETIGKAFSDDEARALVLAARTKQPVVVNDTSSDPRVNRETMERYGIRSLLSVPLVIRGDIAGAISFYYRSAPVTFNDMEVDFAGKLGTSVSLALENARLYSTERDISDTLQEALLTMPQKVPGIEFGRLYRSATEAAKVGGDFYDIFEIEHGRVGIVIGDVSGKGLQAAALTSIVKNTLKAYAYEDISPAAAITKTNEAILRETAPAMFITVFLGLLDTRTGRLSYCNAGHPPGMVRRAASQISYLSTTSPVIGAFPYFSYVDGEAQLEEGDILVLYTDGVTEARCPDGFFGESGLARTITELENPKARLLPDMVFARIMKCTGGNLADDVALLAVSLAR